MVLDGSVGWGSTKLLRATVAADRPEPRIHAVVESTIADSQEARRESVSARRVKQKPYYACALRQAEDTNVGLALAANPCRGDDVTRRRRSTVINPSDARGVIGWAGFESIDTTGYPRSSEGFAIRADGSIARAVAAAIDPKRQSRGSFRDPEDTGRKVRVRVIPAPHSVGDACR